MSRTPRARGKILRRDLLRYGAMGMVAALLPAAARPARAGNAGGSGTIASCVIHPAIGVARVGNSPDGFFIGPEVPGPRPAPDGGYKDAAGRMKRQAARFRIFGLDADGNVVQEITAADADITWTVHLANKKAAWYDFDLAFDIPEAQGQAPAGAPGGGAAPVRSARRNAGVTGSGRSQLVIDPGPRTIAGTDVNAGGDPSYAFDSGTFLGQRVPLGELRTDDSGRLLVLGGFGSSASALPGQSATAFANNDGWHDDTADGPVEATVQMGGQTFQATGAWAVVAPPNFAPGIRSVVTMYDVLFEAATKLDPARAPVRPSFTRQIYPLLERHVQNQWVNAGFARLFGWGTPGDLLAPATLATLADASDQSAAARGALFQRFRDPTFAKSQPNLLPPCYGDNTDFPARSPRQWLAVLPIQYGWLRQWAAGDFDADWPVGGLSFPDVLEDLPVDEQPGALDRAALDDCAGGPFHPGCELSWPMRVPSLYQAPFRPRRRADAEPDWGDAITTAIALGSPGPLDSSGPGDLTRWLAVPWQADTASCLSAYEPEVDEYLPAFWPARVPNDVLTLDSYRTLLDGAATAAAKQAAFTARAKWLRGLPLGGGDDTIARINSFVRQWSQLGVVTRQTPGSNDAALPPALWVETGRALPAPGPPATGGPPAASAAGGSPSPPAGGSPPTE